MLLDQTRHVLRLLVFINSHRNVDVECTPSCAAKGPEGAGQSGGTNSTS